jgi:hypothetical protein
MNKLSKPDTEFSNCGALNAPEKSVFLHEVEGNSPLEDYFCHLSQNGINFLCRQVWLIGLNKNKKSRRWEGIDTHAFDHV